jgi:hypothetical protein
MNTNATLSLQLAKQLKASGLDRDLQKNDFFGVPDRGLDDIVFVCTDMTITLETIQGEPMVTFHGVSEWALDHVMMADVVWLPTEGQLREMVARQLVGQPEPVITLLSTTDGYRCIIHHNGKPHTFDAFGATECYALALLHLLQNSEE